MIETIISNLSTIVAILCGVISGGKVSSVGVLSLGGVAVFGYLAYKGRRFIVPLFLLVIVIVVAMYVVL